MFGKGLLKLRIVLLLVFVSFVGIVHGQDSIPESIPQLPVESPTPPTDITPETPTEIAEPSEISSENNTQESEQNYVDASEYTFEQSTPQPIRKPKEDIELLAALEDNPFVLIRDGQPKKRRISLHGLPSQVPIASIDKVEKSKKEEAEEAIIEEVEDIFVPVDTSIVALNKSNPFRLEGSLDDRKTGTVTKKIKFNPEAGTGAKSTDDIGFNPIFDTSKVNVNPSGTLNFVVILFLLGLLTFIVSSFRSEVMDVYRGFLSSNLLSLLYREKGTILRLPYFSMYILATCSFGTMAFLSVNLLGSNIFESNILSILGCIGGVGLIFLLKHLSIFLLALIFPFKKEVRLYGFTIAIFNFVVGIGLLPIITLIAFAPDSFHDISLYITLILVGFVYIFRTIRSIIIGNKYLIYNKFHFFMYICTVELAPILILIKLLGF